MPLFERLETLEKVADIRDVTRLLLKRSLPGTVTPAPVPIDAQTHQLSLSSINDPCCVDG
jgi:hypothetical protein